MLIVSYILFLSNRAITVYDAIIQMDENGWIPLAMVASFRRIQRLTQNLGIILEVIERDMHINCAVLLLKREWEGKFLLP